MSTAKATANASGLALVDRLGRPLSATRPGAGRGHRPPNKGRRYPPDPYSTSELFALLRACTPTSKYAGATIVTSGARLRAAIVVMWRSGLRVQECLDLTERDLQPRDRLIVVRSGKGGKRRLVAMDDFGWSELDRWIEQRRTLPTGPVFCTTQPGAAGYRWDQNDLRRALRTVGERAGLTRRCNPHNLRHTCAVDLWREGLDIYAISKQLGHARLDVTAQYLSSLGAEDLLTPIKQRAAPALPMDLQLKLTA